MNFTIGDVAADIANIEQWRNPDFCDHVTFFSAISLLVIDADSEHFIIQDNRNNPFDFCNWSDTHVYSQSTGMNEGTNHRRLINISNHKNIIASLALAYMSEDEINGLFATDLGNSADFDNQLFCRYFDCLRKAFIEVIDKNKIKHPF